MIIMNNIPQIINLESCSFATFLYFFLFLALSLLPSFVGNTYFIFRSKKSMILS